ncbi:MAG: hypothetical protein K8R45_11950 [Desulfobacterales bacterium]|nr:hypothetical protein [Desulfobacterales bacterium]
MSAWKSKLIISVGIKFVLYTFRKLKERLDLRTINRETSEVVLPLLKNHYQTYQENLPFLLSIKLFFITQKDKARLALHAEYLEDVIEALEIGLDTEVASRIEEASKGINPPAEIPPWREALEQL